MLYANASADFSMTASISYLLLHFLSVLSSGSVHLRIPNSSHNEPVETEPRSVRSFSFSKQNIPGHMTSTTLSSEVDGVKNLRFKSS